MPHEDYQNLTEADFENLPPLVPEGADREEILAGVIEKWIESSHELKDSELYKSIDCITVENHPAALKRIDLRDDNPDAEPIDLGIDLLVPLTKRLQAIEANQEERKDQPSDVHTTVWMLGCKIHSITANNLELPYNIILPGCWIEEVEFSGTRFGGKAYFENVRFRNEAFFVGALFNEKAYFLNAIFDWGGYFELAKFSKEALFIETKFCGGWSDFKRATFGGKARFLNAVFDGIAVFESTRFDKKADFKMAKFAEVADFERAEFAEVADFEKASFLDSVMFFTADFRKAKLAPGYLPLQKTLRKYLDWQYLTDQIEWSWVRSLGELTLLTRVSYLSLIGVPLLAGLWGPMRTWILQMDGGLKGSLVAFETEAAEKGFQDLLAAEPTQSFLEGIRNSTLDETMPTSWLLAFLAAFFVVIAQFIYQTWAPSLVKQYKEEELVEKSNELIRRGEKITNNWLRESVDYLRDAWQRMPHRHNAWFVKRGLQTVWIPNNVEEHFIDAREEMEKPEEAPDDWQPPIARQTVRAEDRKRIAIEEGQKARYAIEVFTNRKAAWLSGGFYIVGGWLTLMIIVRQLSYVLAASEASDWACLPRNASNGWVAFGGTASLLLLTFIGWGLVKEPDKSN